MSNTSVLGELFSTLGKLSVRDEFCQEIMDLGGLALILKSMEANIAHMVSFTRLMFGCSGLFSLVVTLLFQSLEYLCCSFFLTSSVRLPNYTVVNLFQSIVKQLLGVIKAVAGNDNVKVAIAKENGFELILGAMSKHMSQEKVCELGCAAIAAIILRQPKHCQRVMDANGAAVIIQAMNVHKKSDGVQVS